MPVSPSASDQHAPDDSTARATPDPAPGEDVRAHREWLLSLCDVPARGTVVDLGCGRGEDLRLLAARHPHPDLQLIGVDASERSIAAARAATPDARVEYRVAPLDATLPFPDAAADVVYSHNLLECLPDPRHFARQVARVLRPGGQVVTAHWDWDTQLFDGSDRARVRRLVHAYADWQQAWMAHADPWMGRRLWGTFSATGRFRGHVHARVLTNTRYTPGSFGHANAQAFTALVRRGLASAEDCERFLEEQRALDAQRRYLYSITGYAFVGRRQA